LETEVLNADPVKLVTLLYRGALDAVAAARAAFASGNIPERSRQITKAWEIVNELRGSLKTDQSADLTRQLGELYAYVGQRLLDANTQQSERPLTEASTILTILAEAWQGVQAKQPRGPVTLAG
jgi:flagellar protein FliS